MLSGFCSSSYVLAYSSKSATSISLSKKASSKLCCALGEPEAVSAFLPKKKQKQKKRHGHVVTKAKQVLPGPPIPVTQRVGQSHGAERQNLAKVAHLVVRMCGCLMLFSS